MRDSVTFDKGSFVVKFHIGTGAFLGQGDAILKKIDADWLSPP